MIDTRNSIVEHIFKFQDSNRIHIPVNFQYIINNIQGQQQINKNSMIDITPMEAMKLIDKTYIYQLENINYANLQVYLKHYTIIIFHQINSYN